MLAKMIIICDNRSFLIKSILIIVFYPSMHLSETVPDFICNTSRIDAITSFMNGTVFLAVHKYYWILENNTMNPINNESKGLVSDLVPGMRSLKLTVSIRVNLSGYESNELLLFHIVSESKF